MDIHGAREIRTLAESWRETLMVGDQQHLGAAFRLARDRYREVELRYAASITQDWAGGSTGSWRVDFEYAGEGFSST